jgi:hypothetical protein
VHHGILAIVVADNLAAQEIGGFKGVGKAYSPCRTCDIKRNHLSSSIANSSLLRDEKEHRDRVSRLENLTDEARKYWRKEWGLNGGSILLDAPHFEITKCMLHDPMHLLLEGV